MATFPENAPAPAQARSGSTVTVGATQALPAGDADCGAADSGAADTGAVAAGSGAEDASHGELTQACATNRPDAMTGGAGAVEQDKDAITITAMASKGHVVPEPDIESQQRFHAKPQIRRSVTGDVAAAARAGLAFQIVPRSN